MRYFLYTVFLLFPVAMLAQPASSIDFGGGLGVSSYHGDINQEKIFYKPNFSLEGFVRYNFNKRYAIRANIMSGKLEGDDKDFKSPYQQRRNKSFSTSLMEIAVVGEVNFFPYVNPREWGTAPGTVYAMIGLASAMKYGDRKERIRIPSVIFGVGYKKALGHRWAFEMEWAFRKNLNDKLDGIIDPIKIKKTSKLFNNDWYNVLALKLSYNLWVRGGKCRTFEKDSDL